MGFNASFHVNMASSITIRACLGVSQKGTKIALSSHIYIVTCLQHTHNTARTSFFDICKASTIYHHKKRLNVKYRLCELHKTENAA